jgi:hypothetical protein
MYAEADPVTCLPSFDQFDGVQPEKRNLRKKKRRTEKKKKMHVCEV